MSALALFGEDAEVAVMFAAVLSWASAPDRVLVNRAAFTRIARSLESLSGE